MNNEMKMLFENWRGYNTDSPFVTLLKEHDIKPMSDQQLFLEWKKQTLLELKKLEEIDWEKEAQLTADPDYKPPHERGGIIVQGKEMLAAGWEKVNEWLLQKALELIELAKRSLTAVVKAASWLNKQLRKFENKHPLLYDIVKWVLIIAVIAGLVYLTSGEAQAQIQTSDGKIVSDTEWKTTRGFLSDWANSHGNDAQKHLDAGYAIDLLDKMHASEGIHKTDEFKEAFGKMARVAVEEMVNQIQEYRDLPTGPAKTELGTQLVKWLEVGKKLKVSVL